VDWNCGEDEMAEAEKIDTAEELDLAATSWNPPAVEKIDAKGKC